MKAVFLSLFIILFSFSFTSYAQTKAELLQTARVNERRADRLRMLANDYHNENRGLTLGLEICSARGLTAEQAAEQMKRRIAENNGKRESLLQKAREYDAIARQAMQSAAQKE